MPARDPATSPTSALSPSTSSRPSHPAHYSPSSSTFSRISHQDELNSPSSPPPAPSGFSANDAFFTNALRRVSKGRMPRMVSTSATSQTLSDSSGGGNNSNFHGIGHGVVRRKTSMEHSEGQPNGSNAYLSTSSQAIRDSTTRLASLSFTSKPHSPTTGSPSPAETPSADHHPIAGPSSMLTRPLSPQSSRTASARHRPSVPSNLRSPLSPQGTPSSLHMSPAPRSPVYGSVANGRSALSLMMDRAEEEKRRRAVEDVDATPRPSIHVLAEQDSESKQSLANGSSGSTTPLAMDPSSPGSDPNASGLRRLLAENLPRDEEQPVSERTLLLDTRKRGLSDSLRLARKQASQLTVRDVFRNAVVAPLVTLPSVILGALLNVLDGVSYGMILFPATPIFDGFGSLGVSMFFVSCIVSQLVFSLGGSIFPGGNGSMMIEAVPFFHIIINVIVDEIGDDPVSVVSTTMVSFAFSSILTGLVFFALGAFRLGALIGYFPRHILVGCIGGVGIFLIETGLEVARGLKEEGFAYDLPTLRLFFQDSHSILLWTIPLGLAIALRIVTHFFHHQLIFPAYFFAIPVVFYSVVAIAGWDVPWLRSQGWIFDVGGKQQAWWKFYTLFDFGKMNWAAFWAAMPTQLALVFFGILHVPLNIPALGVTLCEDNVNLDRELVAHGISNLAAGLTGTVPNYLTYVNTVLFYRVGGGSRLSGLMLTAATIAILVVGPSVISVLPVMLVGALIFVLGIDLVVEAVWDTRHRVNRMEYITIWAIAIGMTLWDFVIGLLFGIILACIFFVVQSSRRKAIRAVFSGSTAKSTVRRPRAQRAFLQQVGSQTCVMKLQGFLFFGTITIVEDEMRKLLDLATWQHNPIRFLIIDCTLVWGLDYSSAEAFVRVQRLLAAKDVLLILCGAKPEGLVGTALRSVGLWADQADYRVEVFAGLNDALEWTENAYLTAFYENLKHAAEVSHEIDFPKVAKPPFVLAESFENSPRRSHLAKAGGDTLPRAFLSREPSPDPRERQPGHPCLPILLDTFGSYVDDTTFLREVAPYFTQLPSTVGTTLWTQGDQANALYLIESGSLRATYSYDDHTNPVQETMVAGTIAGDLSLLSDTARNATVVVERDAVLWKLDRAALAALERELPEVARRFIQVVLKAVVEEQDVLSSHLIAVLS